MPNEAALAALVGQTNGISVFVESHRSVWRADATSVLAPVPHEVIPNVAGGNWMRTMYSDPTWRVEVNDIFIDPTGGNDENTGFTALTALATGRELFRRWGWGARVEVGPNQATSPDGFLNIHVLDDILPPDSLPKIILGAPNGSIRVIGGVKTVIHAGVLTGVTPMNPAVPAPGGTRLQLTDAAVVTWAPYVGMRGQMINGPAAGGTFMPQRLTIGSPLAVDCTACQTTNEPGFSTVPTTVTPAPGDTYQIQQLIRVNFGPMDQIQNVNDAFGGFNWLTNVIDCEIPTPNAGNASNILSPQAFNGVQINFYNCVFRRPFDLSYPESIFAVACYFTEFFGTLGPASAGASVVGGGAVRIAATVIPAILWASISNTGSLGFNFVSENFPVYVTRDGVVGNVAFWNCVVVAFLNPGGHGLMIGSPPLGIGGARGRCFFGGLVWGNGNAGVGIRVGSGCTGVGPAQNITGAGGDLALSDALLAQWGDITTGTYQPPGGAALSWAAITAAKGIAGFGGGAHNIDQDAHWDKPGAT